MFHNKSRGEGVVTGSIGIDPTRDDYDIFGLGELPDSNILGMCPHGNLLDTRCKLCGNVVDKEYGDLVKNPRRKR